MCKSTETILDSAVMTTDQCAIVGVKNGVETLLGSGPMPWQMKAKDILKSYGFDDFSEDDTQASYALVAIEELVTWMLKMGWTPPPMITHPANATNIGLQAQPVGPVCEQSPRP